MMADFTETPFAEDFQWQLGKLIDDLMHEGMARETAVMVLQMAIEDLEWKDEDD
jgi:hypothetical protein